MDWRGSWTLGTRIARALARIGSDRLLEAGGGGLPRTAAQLAAPEALNALLQERGLPRVTRASLPGTTFESSNCQNFLVDVEWEKPEHEGVPLPKTLYAKVPCAEVATRAFANATGFWAVECAFARNVAPTVPVRVPRVYAVAERGARFVLLLENLHEDATTRLFTNRDMAAGTTLDQAGQCLETFAQLHAANWDVGEARLDALLPRVLHTYLAPGGRDLSRALADAAVGPTRRAAPDLFGERHEALCRRTLEKWDAVVDAWYTGPLTLIHGDSHLANCFEYERDGAKRMGLIDFQGMQWCHGIRDVQYFLIDSLEPDLLARHEAELIEHYAAALASHGVTLDLGEARERYRAYSFQTFMVAVVSFGLGGLTERDATLRTVLARSAAAVDRLDFGGWLDGL